MFQKFASWAQGAFHAGLSALEATATFIRSGLGFPTVEEIEREYEQIRWGEEVYELLQEYPIDQPIPLRWHAETSLDLAANFMYKIEYTWEDEEGVEHLGYWTVMTDRRLSVSEILGVAELFPYDAALSELAVGYWEVTEAWKMPGAPG